MNFSYTLWNKKYKKNDNQITICLHGGAGTGKSYV